ncbi:MAG: hypothetical protein AABW89_01955 [Nanoarchaeota archaeon]
MRYEYITYPEAISKLESSGIADRVNIAIKRGDLGSEGFLSDEDVVGIIRDMIKDGLFNEIPAWQRNLFQSKMNLAFKNKTDHPWKVKRANGLIVTEQTEVADFLAMTGYWSARVLNPKEMWGCEKFGFRNLTDFTGSVTALISNRLRNDFSRGGYRWQTQTLDGRVLDNQITGDVHADLRIFQTDVTPYETFDPLGNQVSYRPQFSSDESNVIAYHSTELSFLVSVIQWIEQHKIPSETLKDKAKDVIEWAKSLGQRGGHVAEHYFGDADRFDTKMAFCMGINPLPKIEDSHARPLNSLATNSGGRYDIYTDSREGLVFVYVHDNLRGKREVRARFSPADADHLVRGILYQGAMGLGRTSARQLIDGLEYKFSPEYETDMKR